MVPASFRRCAVLLFLAGAVVTGGCTHGNRLAVPKVDCREVELSPGGPGGTPAPPRLETRLASATDVVVGKVVSRTADSFEVRVDEVLRGDAKVGSTVRFTRGYPSARLVDVGDAGAWLYGPCGLVGGGPTWTPVDEVRAAL